MAEQFYADPAALRARAPEHERIAADVAATVQTLRNALSAEGAPWGDDDAGRAFAQSYLPEHKQTMDDLDSLVEVLRQSGGDLRQLANNLEDIDLLGARSVGNAGNETQNDAGPTAVGNGTDAHSTDNNAGTEPNATQPPTAPAFAPNAVQPIDQTPAAVRRPTGTRSTDIGTPAADGASSSPQRSDDTSGSRPDRDQPGSDQSGTDQPATGSAGSPAAGVQPVAQADVGRTRPAAGSRAVAGGSPAAGGTPWSKTGGPGTPWSKPTTRPPRVSAPDAGRQDAPPRIPGRPAPARATGKGDDPNRKIAQPNSGESLAERLARELAERYGVQAFGFDTPGVPDVVLTEIVDAVDTVLPQYPQVDLQAIGIDELPDGEPTRLEWDSASHTSRIVLAAHAATDPEQAGRTAAAGSAQRPVYASIVCELGAALDAAGGFRARSTAQRELLTAYLPQAREDRGSLNRTVSGFRTWRAQLSARSFHREQLDPATALAEAFTDVVLNASRATPPAQVLHSLLVRTAGSDQASMSR
ncbi:hypothetical protein ACQPZ2_20395 [Nocardia pseudovaccinii]|uniref:WXG100 family type VII secretion target n=1 Tax=Nocardia pseudovaccinii TaxID=189540 RepID=UPI003D8D8116